MRRRSFSLSGTWSSERSTAARREGTAAEETLVLSRGGRKRRRWGNRSRSDGRDGRAGEAGRRRGGEPGAQRRQAGARERDRAAPRGAVGGQLTFPAANDDCPGVADVGCQKLLLAVLLREGGGGVRQHGSAWAAAPPRRRLGGRERTVYTIATTAVEPHCGPPRPREPIPCRRCRKVVVRIQCGNAGSQSRWTPHSQLERLGTSAARFAGRAALGCLSRGSQCHGRGAHEEALRLEDELIRALERVGDALRPTRRRPPGVRPPRQQGSTRPGPRAAQLLIAEPHAPTAGPGTAGLRAAGALILPFVTRTFAGLADFHSLVTYSGRFLASHSDTANPPAERFAKRGEF